jgi:hypothetical protein
VIFGRESPMGMTLTYPPVQSSSEVPPVTAL